MVRKGGLRMLTVGPPHSIFQNFQNTCQSIRMSVIL